MKLEEAKTIVLGYFPRAELNPNGLVGGYDFVVMSGVDGAKEQLLGGAGTRLAAWRNAAETARRARLQEAIRDANAKYGFEYRVRELFNDVLNARRYGIFLAEEAKLESPADKNEALAMVGALTAIVPPGFVAVYDRFGACNDPGVDSCLGYVTAEEGA